jgi:hypothetical protein
MLLLLLLTVVVDVPSWTNEGGDDVRGKKATMAERGAAGSPSVVCVKVGKSESPP